MYIFDICCIPEFYKFPSAYALGGPNAIRAAKSKNRGSRSSENAARNFCDFARSELVCEAHLLAAPPRGDPGFAYEEDHCLAVAGRGIERLLSPLARREDAAGIEIEEDLMEALTREPFA